MRTKYSKNKKSVSRLGSIVKRNIRLMKKKKDSKKGGGYSKKKNE